VNDLTDFRYKQEGALQEKLRLNEIVSLTEEEIWDMEIA
jgi:hypothetical protein